jgi:hypothetical protein
MTQKEKEYHITLFQEEVNSLLDLKEICVFENGTEKIFIKIEDNKENRLRQNILDRYDNEEYWDYDVVEDD